MVLLVHIYLWNEFKRSVIGRYHMMAIADTCICIDFYHGSNNKTSVFNVRTSEDNIEEPS
jgi:hypothetical protein